jgi:hypothetical protein
LHELVQIAPALAGKARLDGLDDLLPVGGDEKQAVGQVQEQLDLLQQADDLRRVVAAIQVVDEEHQAGAVGSDFLDRRFDLLAQILGGGFLLPLFVEVLQQSQHRLHGLGQGKGFRFFCPATAKAKYPFVQASPSSLVALLWYHPTAVLVKKGLELFSTPGRLS